MVEWCYNRRPECRPAGTYSTIVTDANGCTATASATVSQPATALTATSTAPPITVAGGSTTVTVSASGGTAPYTGTGAFIRTAGTYTFTVTDANGCTALTTIIVSEPSGCNLTLATSVTNAACFGQNSGAVNLTVNGGTSPYTYLWSNGAMTEDINGLAAGTYSVTVVDANECSASATITITAPSMLVVTPVAGTIPCNGTTTTVSITATGGTAPYTGTGTFTKSPGTYQFTVTDAKGCTKIVTVTVAAPDPCPTGCTKTQTITEDFVHTPVQAGHYIWFNSVFELDERCGNQPVIINVTNATIKYKRNNVWITLNVPDSKITLSSNTFWSTTQFINGKWEVKAPTWTYDRNVFMSGLSYLVPAGGIPAGIDDVKWTASISINREGVKIKWKWAAAVYSQFSANYSALGVKPIDGYFFSPYFNADKAGTPELFKNRLKAGGTGWGGITLRVHTVTGKLLNVVTVLIIIIGKEEKVTKLN